MKYDSIIIIGPTASGKTSLSIALAKMLNGEIINADSQQIIKGLNIGTAKITESEMNGIKHHLLDIIEIGEEYSVSEFRDDSMKIISKLRNENKLPIIVGGTGLYVNSLIYDYTYGGATKNDEIRNKYFALAEKNGVEYVHNILKQLDPISAEKIHPNNLKRVVRAIEIALTSDTKKSQQTLTRNKDLNPLIIGLNPGRETLYARIDKRVGEMMSAGLMSEVTMLKEKGFYDKPVNLPIGYSEWTDYFNNKISKEEVVNKIKLDTRHYAKRQMTWFKALENVMWFNPEEKPISDILNSIMQTLKKDI